MARKKEQGINPALEKAISDALEYVMDDENKATIVEKMRVIDRALKLEALKAKLSDADWGSGLFEGDDDPDEKET